jgi:hypothetical protein
MNPNVKDGLLAATGGAVAASLIGLSMKAGVYSPTPKPTDTMEGYETRILFTTGAVFAVLGAAGLASGRANLHAASLGALGLAGAGLLSGLVVTLQGGGTALPGMASTSQSSGAMMGIRPPAVVQMDAALHHKDAPKTTWINTTTGKRW